VHNLVEHLGVVEDIEIIVEISICFERLERVTFDAMFFASSVIGSVFEVEVESDFV